MKNDSRSVDMLNGSLWNKILLFTLPIAASSILQQLFNSCDVAVVGHFANTEAVAAVTSNAPVISLIINIFLGLSVGTNVVIGNLLGQKKTKDIQDAVHTAVSVALLSGFFLIFIGYFLARPILSVMGTPEGVMDYAVTYLRFYFAGMPFIMLYNFGAAILRSKGDTKRPLYALIAAGILNVILNLILVIIFKMEVKGVAIATTISNTLSGLLVLSFLMHETDSMKVNLKKLRINETYLIRMIKIGVPAGLQGMIFSLSNVVIQSAINSFGRSGMAGSGAELNYEYFSFFVVGAFNQAAVSFTSQNFGAGNVQRCKRIFRDCMFSSIAITGLMVTLFVIFRSYCISLYTPDPEAIKYGVLRMITVEAFDCLINSYEIGASALRAMGHSLLPTIETIFGVCVLRIVWIYTVFAHFDSLWHETEPLKAFGVLTSVYPVSWVITGTIVLSTYFIIRKKEFKKMEAV